MRLAAHYDMRWYDELGMQLTYTVWRNTGKDVTGVNAYLHDEEYWLCLIIQRFMQYLASNNCSFNLDGFVDKSTGQGFRLVLTITLNYSKTTKKAYCYQSYQLSHVWDKLLHTDDPHRKSVLMKASDVKPKRR